MYKIGCFQHAKAVGIFFNGIYFKKKLNWYQTLDYLLFIYLLTSFPSNSFYPDKESKGELKSSLAIYIFIVLNIYMYI